MIDRHKLRNQIRAKRNALSIEQQLLSSKQLLSRLITHPKIKQADTLGIYLANNGELDPMLFIQWCWQNNKRVFLPVLHPFSKGHLLFLHFDERSLLLPNRFGIPEPRLTKNAIMPIEQLDIVMTPLVAFDQAGNRLGMGGGFYDRTLSQVGGVKPYLMGLAHDEQQVDKVPTDDWDIPLSEIITPLNSYSKKRVQLP